MMQRKFRYGSILQTSTLQFDGHIREYFVANARKIVAFYILPRLGKEKNFIEVYEGGNLVVRKTVYSPKQIIPAYIVIYWQFLYILLRYFSRNEKIYFINHQPYFFPLVYLVRLLRNLEIIYWIADYYPMEDTLMIRIFRWFVHFYHNRNKITLYISDRVNKVMNGKVLDEEMKKTVMLAINPPKRISRKIPGKTIELCFIGQLVETQGVDLLLATMAQNKNMHLTLIGTGRQSVIERYRRLTHQYGIEDRVFFPNRFFYGEKLSRVIKDCHIAIAPYIVDKNTITYYADPAKIKHYAELGLPIIMTDAAEVAEYIARFKAGIIVERNVEAVSRAIDDMRKNYASYLSGLKRFNEFFNYRTYYKRAFQFLEKK